MRLLNTTNLELEEFFGAVPQYSILSHTWADELSLQQFLDATKNNNQELRSKSGFLKISQASERAKERGFTYIWIDTCCIDKTSSAELTETINSMFAWYRDADECYVFLADVNHTSIKSAEDLAGCRWFTRGWCLQELIAPSVVRFYNAAWHCIGTKAQLTAPIGEVTGIQEPVLRGARALESVPVAQRMSWAAHRVTTRLEDIAYSLLGIFDVHMPLLYGEGHQAFTRLQEEIIRKQNDLTIFAWELKNPEHRTTGEVYMDMLASTPSQFEDCRSVEVVPHGSFHHLEARSKVMALEQLTRATFSLTNAGILYSGTLDLFQEHRADTIETGVKFSRRTMWRLRLPLEYPADGYKDIYLRMIAPHRFVRIAPDPDSIDSAVWLKKLSPESLSETNVLMLTKVPRSLHSILDAWYYLSIGVNRVDAMGEDIRFEVTDTARPSIFDKATQTFITLGKEGDLSAWVEITIRDLPLLSLGQARFHLYLDMNYQNLLRRGRYIAPGKHQPSAVLLLPHEPDHYCGGIPGESLTVADLDRGGEVGHLQVDEFRISVFLRKVVICGTVAYRAVLGAESTFPSPGDKAEKRRRRDLASVSIRRAAVGVRETKEYGSYVPLESA